MTFYIEKEGTILLHDEDKQRLENTKLFMPAIADAEILETDRKIISRDNMFVFADTVIDELALEIKNDLIEKTNFDLKAKVAYTGVLFDKDGEELCFETNKESMSLINFTVTQVLAGSMTEVTNWKCRKVEAPHEPVAVNFTVEQFNRLIQFAGAMVKTAFAVEDEVNKQINLLTAEQLNDAEFIEAFKVQIADAYAAIEIKIADLFVEEDVETEE